MTCDVAGRELKVGQKVAFITSSYKELRTATVIRVTPHGATVILKDEANRERPLNRNRCQVCIISEGGGNVND